MSPLEDYIDWLGGFPFEVAAPDRVLRVLARSGFGERVDRSHTEARFPEPAGPAKVVRAVLGRVQSHAPTRRP